MVDVDDLVKPVARLVFFVARALWWLSVELLVETIGWSIGWCVMRALTLGRYPDIGIGDMEEANGWARILVQVVGLVALAGALGWLAGIAGH